jgi:hypothetical protein
MTVTQVGRTANSVTINVSGIDYGTGSRQTDIYIPKEQWQYSLSEAEALGFIASYSVSAIDAANGDITVEFFPEDTEEYKVWRFYVTHDKASGGYAVIEIDTVLDFAYEGTKEKHTGDVIDITVSDLHDINLFGGYLYKWAVADEDEVTMYRLKDDGISTGDDIYAEYVYQPAFNLCNAAYRRHNYLGTAYADIYTDMEYVYQDCESGGYLKADYFNKLANAINNFNLTISV